MHKFNEEMEIDVYVNKAGTVTIKGVDYLRPLEEQDNYIRINSRKRAFQLAKAIMDCARNATFERKEPEDEQQ